MASFYSNFFSSGLLAPHEGGAEQPDPTTPRAAVRALAADDKETTPTPADPHTLASASSTDSVGLLIASSSSNNVLPSSSPERTRPALRRRRSSLGIAAMPATPLKTQRAAASVRQNRARAGSVTDGVLAARTAALTVSAGANATANTNTNPNAHTGAPETRAGMLGRLRSGSVGAALKPRRQRTARLPGLPAPPAPTAPLPELPSGTPRRPSAARRSHTTELSLPTLGLTGRCFPMDYPSPLDTPASASSLAGSTREDYFGSDVVMAL